MVKRSLEEEIAHLLNCKSMESESDTPDFILAQYLIGCLEVWNKTIRARDKWYSFEPWDYKKPALVTEISFLYSKSSNNDAYPVPPIKEI